MGREIERKFLVVGDAWREKAGGVPYRQGYLTRGDGCTVRVRRAGDRAFITVKGRPEGIVRDEFEYGIPVDDAEEMIARLCSGGTVEKYRFRIRHAGKIWEVDEFLGDNAGLVLAEIELSDPEEAFDPPPWIGGEVTGDPRYANSSLAREPWCRWGRR